MKFEVISGFINVDKPAGITSHDVIFKLRRSINIKRIGHTGTLDPDATGVLPVAIGSSCRLISYLSQGKVYLAEILLGVKTDTDDLSGKIIERKSIDPTIDLAKISRSLQKFVGEIKQTPPIFSAVHHEGKRLHHLARRKKFASDPSHISKLLAKVAQRIVNIQNIDLLKMDLPVITLRVKCSAGTYIRSLARDLGEALECGACLQSLRREESGPFSLAQSHPLDNVLGLIKEGKLLSVLTSPESKLDLKMVELDQASAFLIAQGKYLPVDSLSSAIQNTLNRDELIFTTYRQFVDSANNIVPVALARIGADGFIKPKVGLIHPEQLEVELV